MFPGTECSLLKGIHRTCPTQVPPTPGPEESGPPLEASTCSSLPKPTACVKPRPEPAGECQSPSPALWRCSCNWFSLFDQEVKNTEIGVELLLCLSVPPFSFRSPQTIVFTPLWSKDNPDLLSSKLDSAGWVRKARCHVDEHTAAKTNKWTKDAYRTLSNVPFFCTGTEEVITSHGSVIHALRLLNILLLTVFSLLKCTYTEVHQKGWRQSSIEQYFIKEKWIWGENRAWK